jgi:hypothetical protein
MKQVLWFNNGTEQNDILLWDLTIVNLSNTLS